MTIAGKINALVLAITIFLGVMATGFTAQREYRSQLDQVIEQSQALLAGLPDLQVDIYFRNRANLVGTAERFLAPPAISYLVLYDTDGEPLLRQSRSGPGVSELPEFRMLRRGASATEINQLVFTGTVIGGGRGLFTAIFSPDTLIQLTLPVFSALSPLIDDLTPADFGAAVLQPAAIGSLHAAVEDLRDYFVRFPVAVAVDADIESIDERRVVVRNVVVRSGESALRLGGTIEAQGQHR